jgi:hypothetical protein
VGARLWRWAVGDKVRPFEMATLAVSVAAVASAVWLGVATDRHQEQEARRQANEKLRQDATSRADGLTSRDGYRERPVAPPLVSFLVERPRPATPYVDHRTAFTLENRSPHPISDFQLLLDLKDPGRPDSTTAGAVRLSTSDSVPGCTRLTFTTPRGLDLGARAPKLRGKRIYLQDPQIFFGYLDREFRLREAGAVFAKPAENSPPSVFPGDRFVTATPIGEVVRLRSTPLDCVAGPALAVGP